MEPIIPITASFHVIKTCNFKCKFCYATFKDTKSHSMIKFEIFKVIFNYYTL